MTRAILEEAGSYGPAAGSPPGRRGNVPFCPKGESGRHSPPPAGTRAALSAAQHPRLRLSRGACVSCALGAARPANACGWEWKHVGEGRRLAGKMESRPQTGKGTNRLPRGPRACKTLFLCSPSCPRSLARELAHSRCSRNTCYLPETDRMLDVNYTGAKKATK